MSVHTETLRVVSYYLPNCDTLGKVNTAMSAEQRDEELVINPDESLTIQLIRQLTRMEGTLSLILFRVDDAVTRVENLEQFKTDMLVRVQKMENDFAQHIASQELISETRKDEVNKERNKALAKWSPITRFSAIIGGLFGGLGLFTLALLQLLK